MFLYLNLTGRKKRALSSGSSFGMFSGLGGTVIAVPDREITAPLQKLLEVCILIILFITVTKNIIQDHKSQKQRRQLI